MREKKSAIDSVWKDIQYRFVQTLEDRVTYLAKYFEGRYAPLKVKFKVINEDNDSNMFLYFTLVGENDWSINKVINIYKLGISQYADISEISAKYSEEIKNEFEYEIIKEGVRSINTRKV